MTRAQSIARRGYGFGAQAIARRGYYTPISTSVDAFPSAGGDDILDYLEPEDDGVFDIAIGLIMSGALQ